MDDIRLGPWAGSIINMSGFDLRQAQGFRCTQEAGTAKAKQSRSIIPSA